MKKSNLILALLVCWLTCSLNVHAQNENSAAEKAQIVTAINHYIDGTSYSYVDRIEKAFYEEADLFLDNKEKTLWVVPSKEYIGWFKKNEPGKFTGRIGNIISIDQFENIATAKAEILIPESNLRFIDMFLLKKIKGEWKIISKTAGRETSNQTGKRILFITSNALFYGDTELKTGNSFAEIVFAYDTFFKAGYTVDFVSPDGGMIPLAYINTSRDLEREMLYDSDFMYQLKNTMSPAEVDPAQYQAVYYVGGGSAMFEVPENEAIQEIAMSVYEKHNGVISSVCHGTAGIVHLKTKDGKYLVDGKRVNGYPDSFENQEADYFKTFPFLIQKTIEERNGDFKFTKGNVPHVEVDGRLITGQNWVSSKPVAEKIIEVLETLEKK